MMMKLPDVTVCAVDSITPQLAARAIALSMQQCEFADALLISDTQVTSPARHIAVPPIDSRESYSRFVLEHLADHIDTPFVLIVQWDGYVVNADRWDPRFLDYDYIGAPWPFFEDGHDVGNGGFSLRSRRMLAACRTLPPDDELEDLYICRKVRPVLEQQHGIRFAPAELASRFSYDSPPSDIPTFGFHGMYNLPNVMDDTAFLELVAGLNLDKIDVGAVTRTMLNLLTAGRWSAARHLFRQLPPKSFETKLPQALIQFCGGVAAARTVVDVLRAES